MWSDDDELSYSLLWIDIKLKWYLQSEKIDKQENEPTKTYDDSEPTQINPLASLVF